MSKFVTRWTELPDAKEFVFANALLHYIGRNYEQHLGDHLLKDLWKIVLSYIDYQEPFEVSMPLGLFSMRTDNGYRPWHGWWWTHVCGREGGKDFKIHFASLGQTLQFPAYFPVYLWAFMFTSLQIVDSPETCYIIRMNFNMLSLEPFYWIQEPTGMRETNLDEPTQYPKYKIDGGCIGQMTST